jgi:hypothetical protein
VEVLHYSYCYYIQYIYFPKTYTSNDTFDTQRGVFREPDHIDVVTHTITHVTHKALRVNTYVVKSVTDQALSARARALARFSYAYYVRGANSRLSLTTVKDSTS